MTIYFTSFCFFFFYKPKSLLIDNEQKNMEWCAYKLEEVMKYFITIVLIYYYYYYYYY